MGGVESTGRAGGRTSGRGLGPCDVETGLVEGERRVVNSILLLCPALTNLYFTCPGSFRLKTKATWAKH